MLRPERHDGRLIKHIRQMFRITRWECVMAAGLDVFQFVEWVPAGTPGFAFLIGAEQIPGPVERHPIGEPHARANRLPAIAIG